MESVEELTVPLEADLGQSAEVNEPKARSLLKDPWVAAAVPLALDVALVGGMFWMANSVNQKLDATQANLQGQYERSVAELNEKTEALRLQNEGLQKEVSALHSYVASKSEEDVIFLKIVITKKEIDRTLARQIAQHVRRYSALYAEDPDLVLAIMAVESDFDPSVVSNMGAVGLMQVMPQWAKILGVTEPLSDPETSIRHGLQILGFYKAMYKDLETALTAYNRGPGAVDWALMKGQSPLNRYAPRVLKTYEELKSLQVGERTI
jgi:hypothetical protein